MKDYTIRKNKHYTTITINNINRKILIMVEEKHQSLIEQGVATVVKPSKQAFQKYINNYKPVVQVIGTPVGHIFQIMGVCFKVIKRNENWITLTQGNQTFMIPASGSPLLEGVYEGITGGLLYF